MSNFFVVLPALSHWQLGKEIFQNGLDHSLNIRKAQPSKVLESEWVSAASFARDNKTGTPLVVDPQTGSWIVACGTWFHQDGYGSGQEQRLLNRYLHVGANQLGQELEGFFVIIIGNSESQEVWVITDIIGSCHAFIRSWKGVLALSNSSLLLGCLDQVTLDPVGCQEFVNTGVVYEDRTIYHEVKKLEPGQVYCFGKGMKQSQISYWNISDLRPNSLDNTVAVDRLVDSLLSASKRITQVYPNLVCDLTSGYDSRAVVAAFLKSQSSFSTTVSGEVNSPDVIISSSIAKAFGISHLHMAFDAPLSFQQVKESLRYTDGEYDLIEYSRILRVHQSLSQSYDVSVNGSFGEVARGYWWELLYPSAGKSVPLDAQQIARKRYVTQMVDETLFSQDHRLNLISHFAHMIQHTNAGLEGCPNTLQMDHAYLRLRMQRWQGKIASSTNRLWPCVSPCMFRSVLEVMLQTSTDFRRRGLFVRQMLETILPQLAEFPLEHGWPAVPVRWNTVHKFWPVPMYFGRKVIDKLASKSGLSRRASSTAVSELPLRVRLWKEEEVQDLFASSSLMEEGFIESRALSRFLEQSRSTEFCFDEQWSRLLSLECAFSIVKQTMKPLPL